MRKCSYSITRQLLATHDDHIHSKKIKHNITPEKNDAGWNIVRKINNCIYTSKTSSLTNSVHDKEIIDDSDSDFSCPISIQSSDSECVGNKSRGEKMNSYFVNEWKYIVFQSQLDILFFIAPLVAFLSEGIKKLWRHNGNSKDSLFKCL